jgi:YaiO family outer membrane protein
MTWRIMSRRMGVSTLALALVFVPARAQEDIRGRAEAALKSGDNEEAVRLCLEGLRTNQADYELNFLLGRAYALAGRSDEALRVLDDLALAHPENLDVLLFRARVRAWKHDYPGAQAGFDEVLGLSPENREALIGLAEIASWQGDYAGALALYGRVRDSAPADADIYFRIGRVYLWQGNFGQAQANLKTALQIDPRNGDYQRELQKAKPRLQPKFELRYEHQTDDFSDARSRYLDQNLAFQASPFKTMGPLLLKYNQTERAGRRDHRYGLEFYPRFGRRAYGYIDLAYSPQGVYYPETAVLLEAYQAVFSAAEISLGVRRMNFAAEGVTQYLGSLGYYSGRYYATWRWYYAPGNSPDRFSWLANIRRYFSADSFLFFGLGNGLRTEDVETWEDYRADQRWVFLAGFNWYLLSKVRLQAYYSAGDEGSARRRSLFLCLGFRW